MSANPERSEDSATPDLRERSRLRELRAFDILDTPPEQVFDEFARLAASIIGTPIALVSFVDEQRQWFKARYGLAATETPREFAFCDYAIQGDKVFVVPDATHDARFVDNPLVTGDPNIRFYAGAPLLTPSGEALGTLCVIDRVPREISAEQKDALQLLSSHVVAQMELRRCVRSFMHENLAKGEAIKEFRRAISAQEFRLRYRPTIGLADGRIRTIKACLRWQHGQELVAPEEFAPLLEDSEVVAVIGRWILERAAADYRQWRDRGLSAPLVSIPIPNGYFRHTKFLADLDETVGAAHEGVVPLAIELAESVLVDDSDLVPLRIEAIHKRGGRVIIDEFGTGRSSLRYLARARADSLKIHESFVHAMTRSADEMAVVSAIITLARSLGMSVIAAGVEEEEQGKLLRLLRCDQMQGPLVGGLVDSAEIEALLARTLASH